MAMSSSIATTTTVPTRTAASRQFTTKEGAAEQVSSTPQNDHDRFFWTYTEEPHRSRRQAIIKAHPEVRFPGASVPLAAVY